MSEADHGASPTRRTYQPLMVPASASTQDAYDCLRSRLAASVEHYWSEILDAHPDIKAAQDHLEALLEDNPNTAFDVFQQRDLFSYHRAGRPVFLR